MLEGDFAATYLTGDNAQVVATDTMKNTVQVLAREHLGDVLEHFVLAVARHFIKRYTQVTRATVEVTERPWDRHLMTDGNGHPHMFTGRTSALPYAHAMATREGVELQAGVRGVLLLKSTGSAFEGYPRCEYTTLPEAKDRIMATQMDATWTFAKPEADFAKINAAVFHALVETYAEKFSPSLQNTLYEMGGAALAAAPEIAEIHLAMPNKHYLPVNLKPFGLENENEIFLPTDEPHGQIEARIRR